MGREGGSPQPLCPRPLRWDGASACVLGGKADKRAGAGPHRICHVRERPDAFCLVTCGTARA